MRANRQTGALMRSKARESVLQYLFQLDFTRLPAYSFKEFLDEIFPLSLAEENGSTPEDRLPLSDNAVEFACNLVEGVRKRFAELDRIISKNAKNWTVSRMTPADRNIIRMATYEMMFCTDVPDRVAINEAINLAKKYGGEKSGAFVNSVLDKIKSFLNSGNE